MTQPLENKIALALGSNVGDRLQMLRSAYDALAKYMQISTASGIYETPAAYVIDQPDFLNAVVLGMTVLPPRDLLAAVKALETELGRKPNFRNGPRAIDIDILFYGDERIDEPALVLPHPRMAEREFVLRPLADIAPMWRNPLRGSTVAEMLEQLPRQEARRIAATLDDRHMFRRRPGQQPLIMGIVNVTPDSFSGDGVMQAADFTAASVAQAAQMQTDGAVILDIGGESTRPGAAPVPDYEEIRRLKPVLEALAGTIAAGVALSVDTMKAKTAAMALAAGATVINDVTALAGDAAMAAVVAEHKATVVLMHNTASAFIKDDKIGGEYPPSDTKATGGDFITDIKDHLSRRIDHALAAGISTDKIVIDPGIGFGKSLAQNLTLINQAHKFQALGFPVLLGPSRKSFIGRVLDTGIEARLEGCAATVAAATLRGVDILRVHDVRFMARVAKMTAAIGEN